MTHPTDAKLEATAAELQRFAANELTDRTAAMLRACKGRDATVFETGLNTALKVIASIGYGKNKDVDEGHEESYRAVETYLKDWKANKPAALAPAPEHCDWNAAIEAAADACISAIGGVTHYGSEPYEICAAAIRQLKKGSPQ